MNGGPLSTEQRFRSIRYPIYSESYYNDPERWTSGNPIMSIYALRDPQIFLIFGGDFFVGMTALPPTITTYPNTSVLFLTASLDVESFKFKIFYCQSWLIVVWEVYDIALRSPSS